MVLCVSCNGQKNISVTPVEDAELYALIAGMSIEEKVGQMTQLNLDVVSVGEIYNLVEPHQLDEAKLKKAIVEKHVGSMLNVGGHAYDLKHWQEMMTQIQTEATTNSKQGIPILYGIDAIHGANYLMDGTLFPQPLGQAATWNKEYVKRCAEITAYETRATGVPWNFSPVLDVARQPLWSRIFETYGEDVYLAKTLGSACIEGYQGKDPSSPNHVAACMKHFLGYSWSYTGKDRTPVYVHERQLREYYLPTFEAAIKDGALSVMINSGELNGIPVHADKAILTDLLRTELKFDGVAVTDWEDIMKLKDNHLVAATLKDAVKMAVLAGIDMSMTPNDYSFTDLLIELVKEGEVTEARLDESVFRILLMKKRLGLFKEALSFKSNDYSKVGSAEHDEVNLQVAQQSLTLLKNDNKTLPIAGGTKKILVTGPSANSMVQLNGAWTRTWQGTDEKYDDQAKMTVLEALQAQYGDRIVYHAGSSLDELIPADLEKMKAIASSCSHVIVCLGELPSTEKPGDIDDLSLPAAQKDLVRSLDKLGLPIVSLLLEDRPRTIADIEPMMDAVLLAYRPGDEGGRAIANVISGKVNPSGRLPITYPKHPNTLLTYDHKRTEELAQDFSWTAFDPQWEFGHGMSYSTVKYSDLVVSKKTFSGNEKLEIKVTITNSSTMDHREVLMLFISDKVASITPPVKRLRKYQSAEIKAGQSITHTFYVSAEDLAFVNRDNEWETEAGEFDINLGGQTASFNYTK